MDALLITGEDNVAIAVKDIHKEQRVILSNKEEITALDDIPYTICACNQKASCCNIKILTISQKHIL